MDKPKVYIIDDSLIFRAMLETMVLEDDGFDVTGIAVRADDALTEIGWKLPDIILLDLNFRDGMSGLAFLEEIEGHWHNMHVIVVSGDAKHDSDVCREAFRRGATACFDKAHVIRSGRELIELMHDLCDHGAPNHRFSRAISLPMVQH
jgi:chemotaxis response regulator CheB